MLCKKKKFRFSSERPLYMGNWWLLSESTLIMGLREISAMLNFDPTKAKLIAQKFFNVIHI